MASNKILQEKLANIDERCQAKLDMILQLLQTTTSATFHTGV